MRGYLAYFERFRTPEGSDAASRGAGSTERTARSITRRRVYSTLPEGPLRLNDTVSAVSPIRSAGRSASRTGTATDASP